MLVARDNTAASPVADSTITQFTACRTAAVPMVATNVCAAVFTALTPAAFAHVIQYSLFFISAPFPVLSSTVTNMFLYRVNPMMR